MQEYRSRRKLHSDLTTAMQTVSISRELQQLRSAVFGSYQERRHNRPTDPEVSECVFYRHNSKRASMRRIHRKTQIDERVILVKDEYSVSFDIDELTKFDDDVEEKLRDSYSSGFCEGSDWSCSCSNRSSKSSYSLEFQVLYISNTFTYIFLTAVSFSVSLPLRWLACTNSCIFLWSLEN